MSEKSGRHLTWGQFMPREKDAAGGTWAAIARYMIDHRTRLGWSQRFAANKAGISADIWNALERERKDGVRRTTLARIALALGRDPQEILDIAEGNGAEGNGAEDD